MKESVKAYKITRGDRDVTWSLRPEPAFRLGAQGDGVVQEGAIFLWLDDDGRPQAAAQVFLRRLGGRDDWQHEFTSLSEGGFVASLDGVPRWLPMRPGVEFKPLPDAPKPAGTAPARLRQMRAGAEACRVEDDFWDRGLQALRLLPTPVARYGKAGGVPEDGALFAFVHGTDPEAFLFVELRPGASGPEWQYAFAPMTCWALRAEHQGRLVWSLPRRNTSNPFATFFSRTYQPPAGSGPAAPPGPSAPTPKAQPQDARPATDGKTEDR
jgi:hypothetical protein